MNKLKSARIAIALLSALVLVGAGQTAFGATAKAGAACTKVGQTTKVGKTTLVCTASGKKKVWKVKAPVVAKPAPIPAPEPVDLTAACKLPVADGRGDVAIAFPRISDRGQTTGVVKSKIIFVDFSDAPASKTTQQAFDMIKRAPEVFSEVSYGRLDYQLDPTYKWYRMSKPATSYNFNTYESQRAYVEEALKLADKDVDFKDAGSFLIFANPDATHFQNGPAVSYFERDGIVLDGTNLHNGATSGNDINVWGAIWLNHEISHSLGLVDVYARDEAGFGYAGFHRYVGYFSYMGFSDFNSQAPGLFAWERWVLDWLTDDQIKCATSPIGQHTITPVETKGGVKALVIPTGKATAIVVESRRAVGLDSKLAKPGALVYKIDTSLQSGFGPLQVQSNFDNTQDIWKTKAPLAKGESLKVGAYTITVLDATADGDVIEVK